jgi:hypothetical protein
MIPCIISDNSITFIARGTTWSLATDHPNFRAVKLLLESGSASEDQVIHLSDVTVAVSDATGGQAELTDEGLFLNGSLLPDSWADKAFSAPGSMRVLLVKAGDQIRVEGDEDAPDGVYVVGEVDDADVDKRIYVESDDGFFGYIANEAVKEIIAPESCPESCSNAN